MEDIFIRNVEFLVVRVMVKEYLGSFRIERNPSSSVYKRFSSCPSTICAAGGVVSAAVSA